MDGAVEGPEDGNRDGVAVDTTDGRVDGRQLGNCDGMLLLK